jgi:hypothetical protein
VLEPKTGYQPGRLDFIPKALPNENHTRKL